MIVHHTEKFKTTIISVRFKEEIKKETIGLRSLLPGVVGAITPTYKTRKALSEALENLYGANLVCKTSKIGKLSIIEYTINIINPSFASDNLIDDALKLLHEIVYGHENLPKKEFELEKRLLIDKIKAFENDKTRYAISRLNEVMFESDNYGLRISGKVSDIEPITYPELNRYYKKVVKTNAVDVVLSGYVTEDLKKKVSKYFLATKEEVLTPIDTPLENKDKVKELTEYDAISQSKINIGYNFPIVYNSKDYYPALLFNTALGGGVHSRLFLNVREKHSLCYYVASNYDAFKGYILIFSGVDKARVDLALKVISEQILDLKTNILKEEELNLSKISLINQLKEIEDAQNASVVSVYQRKLLENDLTLQEMIEKISEVKPEDVLRVAQSLEKHTIYILAPEVKQ